MMEMLDIPAMWVLPVVSEPLVANYLMINDEADKPIVKDQPSEDSG